MAHQTLAHWRGQASAIPTGQIIDARHVNISSATTASDTSMISCSLAP
jgi:hypothetical protein